MLVFNYPSKKSLKESIGQKLQYVETSVFGAEYVPNGVLVGCNRPHLTGHKREFFAQVTMRDGVIAEVK
jgi:hypothetical protein